MNAIASFISGGGTLVVFGYEDLWPEGADAAAKEAFDRLLPARPGTGTVDVGPEELIPAEHPAAAGVAWNEHPPATFLKATPGQNSLALASVGQQGIVWLAEQETAAVFWYPILSSISGHINPLRWFLNERLLVSSLHWGAREKLRRSIQAKRNLWLVSLSLLVCIVGITNAMLMSVTERFREIGTMKCLGALDKFVVRLFLIESSMLGAVGSIVGALFGFLLAFLRALLAYRITDLRTGETRWLVLSYFPTSAILLWAVVAVTIGIILSTLAAIYPAYRASTMDPIEALRHE